MAPPQQRLLFLDNLRYLVVLFVLFFHVAAGYSGLPEYYTEINSGGFFLTLRNAIAPIPRMAILFFVAGYFAWHSLQGRGGGPFFWRKFQRLGIPWLFCIFFLGPLMPYLGYYSQSFNGLSSAAYSDFWPAFIRSGLNLDRWIIPTSFTTNTQFHQMHFWFSSVLLQFYLLLALAYTAWKKWRPTAENKASTRSPFIPADADQSEPLSKQASFIKVFILASVGMAALKALSISLDAPHGLLAFFIQFSPTSSATYGGFFILGIYAYTRNWFVNGQVPGLRTFGLLLGLMVLLGGTAAGVHFYGESLVPQSVLMSIGLLSEALMVVLFLIIALGLTHRYMNRPSALNAKLAANSYYIYLIHYPLVLVFRLLLLNWDGPVVVKFPLVLVLTALTAYLLSEYWIRPHPRLAAASLVGLNLAVALVSLP